MSRLKARLERLERGCPTLSEAEARQLTEEGIGALTRAFDGLPPPQLVNAWRVTLREGTLRPPVAVSHLQAEMVRALGRYCSREEALRVAAELRPLFEDPD